MFIFRRKKSLPRGAEIEDSVMTVTQKEEAMLESPLEKRSLTLIWCVVILTLAGLAGRVFYLDVICGKHYSDISKGNRVRSIIIKAPRGQILDKYGKVLARNVPSLDAIIIPNDLPNDPARKKDIADELARILEMDPGNIEIGLEGLDPKSLNPVLLKENITQDQALILSARQNEFPGVTVDKTAIRFYEESAIFAPVLGYDGKITQNELKKNPGYMMTDYIGKSGLEKNYEADLRGSYGATQVEVDSLGDIKRNIGVINPVPGSDLVLNIDEELQKKLYDSLEGILEKAGVKTAAAAAIDPRTGGVLALVSLPSYDNNLFAKGISNDDYKNLVNDPSLPLFNRVIAGEYPPGSTLKPAVAAAALSEGVITPSTSINGLGGVLRIGGWSFGDWTAHGPSDVRLAIAQSNDIFFYTVGGGYGDIQGLGMDRMKKYENMFGFGSPTGIDLPGEAGGFIPSESWKQEKLGEKWYIGDSYHCAIGQGFITATPLQLANYTAAIANGGTLYSPRVVSRIKSADGQEKIINAPILDQDFIRPDILNVVREGMRLTITGGTAQTLKTLPVAIAGKTGTAQFGTGDQTHSWFISFAPYDNPTIAMAVLVEGGGEGNSAALPATKETLEWYFSRNINQ